MRRLHQTRQISADSFTDQSFNFLSPMPVIRTSKDPFQRFNTCFFNIENYFAPRPMYEVSSSLVKCQIGEIFRSRKRRRVFVTSVCESEKRRRASFLSQNVNKHTPLILMALLLTILFHMLVHFGFNLTLARTRGWGSIPTPIRFFLIFSWRIKYQHLA